MKLVINNLTNKEMKKLLFLVLIVAGCYCEAFSEADSLFKTPTGKKYHIKRSCRSLARSKVILSVVKLDVMADDICGICKFAEARALKRDSILNSKKLNIK